MSEKPTLDYYKNALRRLRQDINNFAAVYPQMASHLQLGPTTVEDPHVSRLIESFALISGRLDALVNDNYPRITQALMNNLYPSYLNSIPSMSIVRLSPYITLQKNMVIPKCTLLETSPVNNHPCYFETGFETTILPLQLSSVTTTSDKLTLELRCLDKKNNFSNINVDKLRFYINSDDIFSMDFLCFLYQYSASISQNGSKTEAIIELVGFDNDQIMLPMQEHDFESYQLLLEFMYYKKKFFFFDLKNLDLSQVKDTLILDIKFTKKIPANLLTINAEQLQLNCTPIINLFKKNLEPVKITHFVTDYPLIADKRYSEHYQIHHISEVIDVNTTTKLPYQYANSEAQSSSPAYYIHYHHSELNSYQNASLTLSITDSDTLLTLSEIDLAVTGYCTNGNIPNSLMWKNTDNHFQFVDESFPIGHIQCFIHPTAAYSSHLNSEHLQEALTLINQGQLGLYQPSSAKKSLINLLKLYNFDKSAINTSFINSIKEVFLKEQYRYVDDNLLNPLQYGVNVEISINQNTVLGSGLFLFEKILLGIYQQHVAVNSFVTVTILLQDSE